MNDRPHTEESLDPADWEAMRRLGHTMVDDMMDYLSHIRQRPVWQPIPEEVKERFQTALPELPVPAEKIYEDFLKYILPYNKGNVHPRFWAWVQGTGTPIAVLADMLAATMNANVTIGEQSAMYVDQQVLYWCKQMMDFPSDASGMLVSGASMANLTALIVARNTQIPDSRQKGLTSLPHQPVMYTSTEAHSCIGKAAEVIGIGRDGLRGIPVDGQFKIRIDTLREAIEADLQAGRHPFAIVANVGTVNTGAMDDVASLLAIAREYKLWLHVDGAFGALARLTPAFSDTLDCLREADSIAFDLHKWMYIPYEVGCVLIRDRHIHRNAFSNTPGYLVQHDRGLASGLDSLNNYGIELSRGFKALKVWMSLTHYGIRGLADQIRKNIEQAAYLSNRVDETPLLERMAPVELNIVCFRFTGRHATNDMLNTINREIVMRLQEQGIASPSYAILQGQYCIRVAVTNHRSTTADFDTLISEVLRLGNEIIL